MWVGGCDSSGIFIDPVGENDGRILGMGVTSGRDSHNHARLEREPGRAPHELREDWIRLERARDRVVTVGSAANDSPALCFAAIQARRAPMRSAR
jgi:hypothetical protein